MSSRPVVAFVGDGLMADGRWQEWLPGYDARVFAEAGRTSSGVAARLDEILTLRPSAVVLLVGNNDLAWHEPVDHIVRTVQMIIHRVRRECAGTRVIVNSILPREAKHTVSIRQINCHVRQFALTVGAEYLDLWPTLAADDGLDSTLSDDAVTLNDAGYDQWRTAIESVLVDPGSNATRVQTIPTPATARRR